MPITPQARTDGAGRPSFFLRKQLRKRRKTISNQFRAGDGFNALMAGNGGRIGNVLPFDFGGHLHTSVTLCSPYALRMQPYAPIMHFLPASRKRPDSKAERTCKKPYALYAPLLGVGAFLAFFLLREVHTVHKTAYGSHRNWALALLPVGIEAPPARQNQKCIRLHTDFGRFSSESPADEIDSPLPVFDSTRRAGRLLPLETILWPL